ncbi:MAG: 23S rRNA (pseudouridine(1915)-N(3))-methyltransferase RlmH [Gammaproteobacteria bacterium]|nr:23S rRNA (pseudouridine(1915)-N(3))-methyltransferase RlmH [Gammaproteobacteria bacterium]
MPIKILAVGTKMPDWVTESYTEYAKRLPREYAFSLIEIPAQKRGSGSDTASILKKEAQAIMAHIEPSSLLIALDVKGQNWSTEQLAKKLQSWHDESHSIIFLIGGPEGLPAVCLERANFKWSLSNLTYPHPLVRVILSEQLYRAWTIIQNHPYHRA